MADSGATFDVTWNPLGMVECTPTPPSKSSSVVGGMRSLKVECFAQNTVRDALHHSVTF